MVSHCRLILLAGCLLLYLFPGCNLSKEEIPEPNYDPFVLLPATYVEAKGTVVNMDNMAPPDTIIVKGQWKEAKKVETPHSKNIAVPASKPSYFASNFQPVDMSQYAPPEYVHSNGTNRNIVLPPGVRTQVPIESTEHHYISFLNQKHGLTSDWITCLMEDKLGRIWIGTDNGGVSLWDGTTLINLTRQEGFPVGYIRDILEDGKGNIWISVAQAGLIMWNGKEFLSYTIEEGLSSNDIIHLMEDNSGNLWIGTKNGLNVWDGEGFGHYGSKQGLSGNHITGMAEDQHGNIWIGTESDGINIWDGSKFSHFTTKQGLPNDHIFKVMADNQGNVWISTKGEGLYKWNGEGFTHYYEYEGIACWLNDIMEDSYGNIWIGDNFGAHIFDGNSFKTISENSGIKSGVVSSLLEDTSGRIWIGTVGGGLRVLTAPQAEHYVSNNQELYYRGFLQEDSFENIWVLQRNLGVTKNSSNLSQVQWYNIGAYNFAIHIDSYGKLLVGSNGIKVLDVEEFVKSSRYQFYEFEYKIIADAVIIKSILEDRNGNIWMGGGKGLFFWDRSETTKTNSIRLLEYSNEQGLATNHISSLLEDQEGRIWIGSNSGIFIWDGNNFTRFSMDHGLSSNSINQMTMDYNGRIWIGTRKGGITVWDGQGFYSYTDHQGLPASSVYSIHIDQNQNIWAATNYGVIKLWTEVDGQLHYEMMNEYNGVAQARASDVFVSNSNKLWTVNLKNIDVVNLELQTPDTAKPKLPIAGVQPFFDQFDWRHVSNSIIAGETILTGDQEIPLSKVKYDSVYRFSNLPVNPEFPHSINNLTFHWSSSYWADPTSIQYSYLLKGQDQSWSPLVKENKITYNDLDPGGYTLKVRAIAGNARWSDTASYSFTIRPPIWATWFAYTFYGLCGIGFVLGLRHYERKRFILKQKARSLEEVDKVKTEFFTNISHELRTPLTLILGPLKTLQEGTYKGDKKSLLTMMAQNGNRLLRLVNQLLDLSKIDQGKLKLALENCDLNELAQSVVANFDSAASIKNIDLEFFDNDVPVNNWIDREKIKQVLFNLISNAIKFTPIGGNIRVSVASETSKQHPDGAIEIVVKDTGIGIPENELSNIFDRFYQVNKSNQDESEGTGIGLALVQKLVHLHNGEIKVESEPGWGTTFKVLLPVTTAPTSGRRPVTPEPEVVAPYLPDTASLVSVEAESNGKHLPVLLIVEDNAQMRQYIKSCLGDHYNYFEASNGIEGLKMADSELPDLILSDVMMPEMDGYEFCEKIREQDATAHIPLIFLTAKADHESQIKGLEIGSVDYVIKPFDAHELQLKIQNHLDRIHQFRSFFSKQLAIKGEIDVVESLDEKFLKKAIAVVEDHMDNHEFSVNEFSRQAGLSQTQLYRKLMTLTGLSPSAFIRSIRLKKAAQLILQNYGNTSDVTYAVGFNNLSYFAKCFKEQFGVSPSGYGRARLPNQTP